MSDDIEAVVVASDDDDDVPRLSAATLAALQEFYVEQMSEDQSMPKEDWQLSQFWYDDKTAQLLAEEALAITGDGGRIACLSCPSVYRKLREFARDNVSICCLEYDERFSMFGNDFVFYDYNDPLNLPEGFEKAFDVVIADPPFLSEECLRKTAITVKHLAKDRVILCTGAVMEDLARELLSVVSCQFKPRHSNGLANEFHCYTNYKPIMLF